MSNDNGNILQQTLEAIGYYYSPNGNFFDKLERWTKYQITVYFSWVVSQIFLCSWFLGLFMESGDVQKAFISGSILAGFVIGILLFSVLFWGSIGVLIMLSEEKAERKTKLAALDKGE